MSVEVIRDSYCIVYNEKSGRGHNKRSADKLSRTLGGVEVFSVEQYEQPEVLNRLVQIIYSGDGTICSIANSLLDSGQRPVLVIAGGGSENHLQKILDRKNHTVKTSDLLSLEELQKNAYDYRPCVIEDRGVFFVNAGFGNIETAWAKNLEETRKHTPAFIASYLAYLRALVELYPDRMTFNMLLADNPIGSLKLPVDEPLEDQLIQIEIEGKPTTIFFKAFLAAFLWRVGSTMPRNLLKITTGTEFEILADNRSREFNLDGEIATANGNLKVKRSKEHIKMLALRT